EVLGHAEIAEHVRQQAADQELEREVVDALAALGMAGALRGEPAMDDPVADGERGGQKPIAIGGRAGILPDRQDQLGEHGALDFDQRLLAGSGTSLQQRLARHALKLASRAWIIHYLVLQGRLFPDESPRRRPLPVHRKPWRPDRGASGMPDPLLKRSPSPRRRACGYPCAAPACQSALKRTPQL